MRHHNLFIFLQLVHILSITNFSAKISFSKISNDHIFFHIASNFLLFYQNCFIFSQMFYVLLKKKFFGKMHLFLNFFTIHQIFHIFQKHLAFRQFFFIQFLHIHQNSIFHTKLLFKNFLLNHYFSR